MRAFSKKKEAHVRNELELSADHDTTGKRRSSENGKKGMGRSFSLICRA